MFSIDGVPAPASAAEQVVTLGDSLTFAYEAEFGFEVTIQGLGSFGDGFGPEVRNWIEILSDPAYRSTHFELGGRDTIELATSFFPPATETLFLRREFNWAIPGLQIDQLRRFVNGEATLLDLLGESEEFSVLRTALAASDFSDDDFDVDDLREQIMNEAERVVLFIGGNDLNSIYGTVYEGGTAGAFIEDFIADAAFILDWILGINPGVQIVIGGVPHVGITPDVKASFPSDPVKTGRVTEVVTELNRRLAGLALDRGLGFADLFTATAPLLGPAPLCIHGLTFANSGSETGDLDFVWLNGELSYNFHPNTSAQALMANGIIAAFNRTYQTNIPLLTATEILGGLLGRSASAIDLPFTDWLAGFGLPGRPESDDSDGDALPAALEFALGLNPTLVDGEFVSTLRTGAADRGSVEVVYPVRLPASMRFSLTPAHATTVLSGPGAFVPIAPSAVPHPDGRVRAVLPIESGSSGYVRLEATLLAP